MIDFYDTLMYLQYYTKTVYLEGVKVCKGLDYTGRIESNNSSFRGYEGCYPIKQILNKMNISYNDRFLDIGCGKGLSLYYSSIFNFERIDGIEYSSRLTRIAKQNAKVLKDNRIHIYNCDARDFKHYDKYNYFFINNPFSAEIMEQVVCAIIKNYSVNTRKITVIYQFPYSINVFTKHNFEIIYHQFPNTILTFEQKNDILQ